MLLIPLANLVPRLQNAVWERDWFKPHLWPHPSRRGRGLLVTRIMADEDAPSTPRSTPPADLPGMPRRYKLDSCWVINLPVQWAIHVSTRFYLTDMYTTSMTFRWMPILFSHGSDHCSLVKPHLSQKRERVWSTLKPRLLSNFKEERSTWSQTIVCPHMEARFW